MVSRDLIMRTLDTLPEISFEIGSDELTGHVRFTERVEGSGGAAHGGFVAAVFDHVLAVSSPTAAPLGRRGGVVPSPSTTGP